MYFPQETLRRAITHRRASALNRRYRHGFDPQFPQIICFHSSHHYPIKHNSRNNVFFFFFRWWGVTWRSEILIQKLKGHINKGLSFEATLVSFWC